MRLSSRSQSHRYTCSHLGAAEERIIRGWGRRGLASRRTSRRDRVRGAGPLTSSMTASEHVATPPLWSASCGGSDVLICFLEASAEERKVLIAQRSNSFAFSSQTVSTRLLLLLLLPRQPHPVSCRRRNSKPETLLPINQYLFIC